MWSKNHSFLSKISKTIFSALIIPKNPNEKKFDFWTKTMDYPLRKMSIFLAPFKTLTFWSKIILFYQEYRKERFFLTWLNQKNLHEKSSIFGQKPWTNPSEKCCFWHFIELQFSGVKIILFYPKDQKMIFTNLFYPKKIDKKKFDFWTKTVDYPLWQNSMFCPFKNLISSGVKIVLFYPEY